MPCSDGGPSYDQQMEPKRLRATLCGVLSDLERRGMFWEVFDRIDWREAGVSREWAEGWWTEHKAEDARRRKQEMEIAERRATAKKAIEKLTPAERLALGIRRPEE